MSRIATPDTIYHASAGAKFNRDTTLVVTTCPTCHILFAIPKSLEASARRYPGDQPNGWQLSCPLGHTWWFPGRSVEQKLKAEQERAARHAARADQAEAHARAMKGLATRRRNELAKVEARVAAGVCPCCNRAFQNVSRHMRAQHPGFGTEANTPDKEAE